MLLTRVTSRSSMPELIKLLVPLSKPLSLRGLSIEGKMT
jgi:hypothetical protein